MALPTQYRLEAVVVGHAEVFDDVNLTETTVYRHNRSRRIGGGSRPYLTGRSAHEERRRIQINGAIQVRPVLFDVVQGHKKPPRDLALETDRTHMALGVDERGAGVARQLRYVEKPRVVRGHSRPNRDV